MILQTILEGLGLGALLVLVCAVGIRKGAVGMVHLYSPEVQDRCVKLGLTTHAKIKRNALIFKAVCVPGYIAYVLVCVYGINGARGFAVSLYWSKGKTLKKILWCDDESIKPYFIAAGENLTYTNLRRQISDSLENKSFPSLPEEFQRQLFRVWQHRGSFQIPSGSDESLPKRQLPRI